MQPAWRPITILSAPADLVVLDADPLVDLAAAEKVHAVITDGRLLAPDELRLEDR